MNVDERLGTALVCRYLCEPTTLVSRLLLAPPRLARIEEALSAAAGGPARSFLSETAHFWAVRDGRLRADDTRATAETLRLQAEVARAAGRAQLAEGLERAAELTGVPDEELLAVYTALRPGRSSADELECWAARLEELGAPLNAAFVREAAAAYGARGLTVHG